MSENVKSTITLSDAEKKEGNIGKNEEIEKASSRGRKPANHSCIAVDFLLFTAISILRSPQDEFCRNFQLERANCPVRKLKMFAFSAFYIDLGTFYTGCTVCTGRKPRANTVFHRGKQRFPLKEEKISAKFILTSHIF